MTKSPFRLSLREEGNYWNAYLASHGTMDDAQLIGSIAIGAAQSSQKIHDAFQALMVDVVTEALAALNVKIQSWDETTAPETERAGNA